jgi:hypothetical protein
MSPGVEYLLRRLVELEQAMALMIEQGAAKDARIAELEKCQRKPRTARRSAASD